MSTISYLPTRTGLVYYPGVKLKLLQRLRTPPTFSGIALHDA